MLFSSNHLGFSEICLSKFQKWTLFEKLDSRASHFFLQNVSLATLIQVVVSTVTSNDHSDSVAVAWSSIWKQLQKSAFNHSESLFEQTTKFETYYWENWFVDSFLSKNIIRIIVTVWQRLKSYSVYFQSNSRNDLLTALISDCCWIERSVHRKLSPCLLKVEIRKGFMT